jgi:hypothetical protein
LLFLILTLGLAAAARAQDHSHAQTEAGPTGRTWRWSADANVFFGYNYQKRLFADFDAWESQNWVMLAGDRALGAGVIAVSGMASLEPLTIPGMGSPQLFQTGESYQGVPLVNFQHPHDLIMGLGAKYRIARGPVTYLLGADLVGPPALGPAPFMHRPSARNNPQVPITHHFADSSHVSAGVLTAGAQIGPMTVESSVFRGAEPDDRRFALERPRLDSWSARIGWRNGAWHAQFSGGRLHEPEWFEPYDVTRLTVSVGFEGELRSRPFAATAIWGQNRDDNGFNDVSNGALFEWDLGATSASIVYGRAEHAQKALFGLGFHPKGSVHPHFFYGVTAVTTGYLREILSSPFGRIGIAADVTFYRMPENLALYYGSSRSYHLFLRWKPIAASTHVH